MGDNTELIEKLYGKHFNCNCGARSPGECGCDTSWPENYTVHAAEALEKAAIELAEREKELAEALDRIDELESESEYPTWPEWAIRCLRIVRNHSGCDGYDDQDGVDLPTEIAEQLDRYDAENEKLKSERDALAIQLKQMRAAIDSFDLREGTCDAMLVLESRNLAADHEAIIRQHDAEAWERAAEKLEGMGKGWGSQFAAALRAEAEKLKCQ